MTVEPATYEWAYPDIEADYKAGREVWREVSKGFYWQALEVVPPVYAVGGFMAGEPWSHNERDEALRAAFAKVGRRYFATISTEAGFPTRYAGLRAALAVAA